MTWVHLIDVSQVQANIDAEAAVRAGIVGAVVKISEGARYLDPLRAAHLKIFRAAGMLTGAYHFARPSGSAQDARDQFDRFWEGLGDQMPALPFVIDLETKGGLAGSAVCEWACAWVERSLQAWARPPVLYSGSYLLDELGASRYPELLALDLWLAQYSRDAPWEPVEGQHAPRLPKGWTSWSLWQYSGDHGLPVPGVLGACDRNVFNGDATALRVWCGLPESDPEAVTLRPVPSPGSDAEEAVAAFQREQDRR